MSGSVKRRKSAGESARLKILFCLLWFATGNALWSQSLVEPSDWVVDSWQTEAGLPLNSVTCVLQTRDGYLWIGTPNGLARFDGVRFTTFRVADGVGLRSNRILCLFESANGALWIGTEEGGLTSHQQGKFTTFTTQDGLSSDIILCLGEDRNGALWAGTDSGLNRRADGRFTTFFKTDGLPDDRVTAISSRGNAVMVFATGNGLCEFRGDLLVPFESSLAGLARTNLNSMLEDRQGALWLAGGNGLVRTRVLGGGDRSSTPVNSSNVTVLIQRRSGEIWFGSESGELGRVVGNENQLQPKAIWRAPRGVTSLCEDHEGNLWIGTTGDGLYRLKRRQLRLISVPNSEGGNWASCLYESSGGDLQWVARDNGVYRHQAGESVIGEKVKLPEGVVAHTVCQAQAGELWIGTLRDGLFRCTNGGFQQFSERDGLSDSAIEALYADSTGGLWIGTRNGGLNYFNGQKFTRFNTPWGFFGAFACAIEPAADGGLWIGTTGEGLFRFKDGGFTAYTAASGLPSGQIHALEAEADGSLWAGTARGLCLVKAGRVTRFNEGGLAEEAIYQMRSDRDGNLWIGAGSRISRVRKQQLEAFADGRARFVDIVPYGSEDGVAGLQCLPRVQSRGVQKGQGGIWFATTKGLLVIEQNEELRNDSPPNVVLEAVFVENQNTPFSGGVVLPPGKDNLRFEFTALSLTSPGKVNFRYQLEGFDREFSEAGGTRSVRYPNVPPGRYQFQVIACNNDGVWNTTGASVAVWVQPFWWATVWFRTGVALTVTMGLVGLFRLRQARRREIERLRVRIASDLHDDLGSSLWSITLLSRMLAKHGKLGDEERQDISEINRIAIQSSNSIRDIIWLINPAFDSLQDFLLRTKDFAGTALRGVDYRMKCEIPDLSRKLPFDFRHNLFLFFKEALTNIARHANATTVAVLIEENNGCWQLTIRDNGKGFDPAADTEGNGLKNLRARAERMGARLEINSQPGQGSALVLTTMPP